MKRKIVCLMAAIMCFAMTACEKTPDKSLVTQKNIDRLEKAAKETETHCGAHRFVSERKII